MNQTAIKCKVCNNPLVFSHIIRLPENDKAIYLCPYGHDVINNNDKPLSSKDGIV